jgi:hypothetical protein
MEGLLAGLLAGAIVAIVGFLSLRARAPKTINVTDNLHTTDV